MKKGILVILDGVGENSSLVGNAVKNASMPCLGDLKNRYPHCLLKASEEAVGLPKGQMGNSEVGHLTIGSGRVVFQSLERINQAIVSGSFFSNEAFLAVCSHVKKNHSKLHLLGLLSDGGIHSHIDHMKALIRLAKEQGIGDLYFHFFLDGRDTLKDVCLTYLDEIMDYAHSLGIGKIATLMGRYYAMDREKVWDLTKKSYDAITSLQGEVFASYREAISFYYDQGIYDEFIPPVILDLDGRLEENDGYIVANFRPDRLKQLFTAFSNPEFDLFETKKFSNVSGVSMMPICDEVLLPVAFSHQVLSNTLGEVLENNGYSVLRIAEVSKFPHVTHFFDGDKDVSFSHTKQVMMDRKDVATYDLAPEMSTREVTDYILEHGTSYDFIVVNFANGDMVGHTGNLDAAILAMEEVDRNLARLLSFALEHDYTLFVTADHGNCEKMIGDHGEILTAHTLSLVPFLLTNSSVSLEDGSLADIAPTILHSLNMEIPKDMTGHSLIKE